MAIYLYFSYSLRPIHKDTKKFFFLPLQNMIIEISQIPSIYLTKGFNSLTLKMPFYPNLRRLVKINHQYNSSDFDLRKSLLKSNTKGMLEKNKIRFENKT